MSTRRTRASTAETIDDLVRASSLIFTGTVVAVGRSNLRVLEPRENLVLVARLGHGGTLFSETVRECR